MGGAERVRARSQTASQTSRLGPPAHRRVGNASRPSHPTGDDRRPRPASPRARVRAVARAESSSHRDIFFEPCSRMRRYFRIFALRRMPPCAHHSRALERLHARAFPTNAREATTSRETIAMNTARARASTRRRDGSRRGVNCICTDGFDVTGRSRAATRGRRARAMRPTKDARGRAIGIVCACVLLASVATAQRWVRETRRRARARAPMRRKRARRTRRRATIVERASQRARDRSSEGWTDRLTRRRYCCVIVPSP